MQADKNLMLSSEDRVNPHFNVLGLFKLMRPTQWVKNTFVLAPAIFAGVVTNEQAVLSALLAMVLFCVASSATYIVNDLRDMESDRINASKSKSRPLASGEVAPGHAVLLLGVLYGVLIAGFFVAPQVILVIAGYLVMNLCYTLFLKHQPVIDIFIIATGFVLRVFAGAMAIDVPVSSWMFVTTLCLALYLASVKRRQELATVGSGSRKVLQQYSISLVDRYAEMSATGALLFYSLFVMTVQPDLVVTIPVVLFGLFRYWFVVESKGGGESPTDALFSDWQLLVTVLLWGGICTYVILRHGG